MDRVRSTLEKLKWFITNLPVVNTVLSIVIIVCYKIKLDRHFPDVALCVQPHMVMTGQVTRLIKYVVHHKDMNTLMLSISFLALFGTVAERQAGSIRYLFLMAVFALLSSSLTVIFSIILGFSSHYSSLMYSCPALGLMPALFAITVLVFKTSHMKKTIICFFIVSNSIMPWLLLIMSQFIIQDSTFISNLSGCIIGWLYMYGMKNIVKLPLEAIEPFDSVLKKIFKSIPIVKYIPATSPKLPLYHGDKTLVMPDQKQIHQPFRVPDDCPVQIQEDSVPQYMLNKLEQMGFNREQSVVALTAASGNIEMAVSLLSNKQTGSQAVVLPPTTQP